MQGKTIAHASETGASTFAVEIETGGHRFIGDEPESEGGRDLGPAPYQLLTAALAECTAMTIRWYAQRKGLPVTHVRAEVSHEKGRVEGRDGMVDIFTKSVTIAGDALTDEQRTILHDIAGKCPVHRTLAGASHIVTLPLPMSPAEGD